MGSFTIAILALVAILVLLAISGLKIVPQTENWLVERLGKYYKTLHAGVHIIIPFYDKVAHKESILERQLPSKEVSAFTKDNVPIVLHMAIFYRVVDAAKAWYRIKNIDMAIETIIISAVRNETGTTELDGVQSNRSQLSTAIANEIQKVTEEWGIDVTRVEIVDVEVDPETKRAMQLQVAAERTRRAAVTEAEGKRQAANLQADAELYTAQKQAEAQRVLAEAEAYAVTTVAQSIKDGGQAAIDFQVQKIQAEAVTAVGQGASTKIVMLPSDAMSALAGFAGRFMGK